MRYEGLVDELFGAAGSWSMRACERARCGMLWLDPCPLDDDLGLAYERYYTHRAPVNRGRLHAIYWSAARAWLAARYGYRDDAPRSPWRLLAPVFDALPGRREQLEQSVMFLAARPDGRLLDVGCGDGARLSRMRELGWRVTGTDLDERALEPARRAGLDVKLGTLAEQRFASGAFDAVTLSHVIEHVPDPVETLRECRRVLAPGGVVMAVTPNVESMGHARWGARWRGLEPPRHLQVFTWDALEAAARSAGFGHVTMRTVARIAGTIAVESLVPASVEGRAPVPPDVRELARRFEAHERAALASAPRAGEELVLEARA
jgi:2-polyprenyl-3-methyl-5-hydroxy-6-metoxy-1,4-benzoquinol methylase